MKPKIINPQPYSDLRPIKWLDVRQKVLAVNPTLAKIIDDLSPTIPLTLGTYSYGAVIASEEAQQGLPNFLVLDKSCELFFEYHDRPMTYRLLQKGDIGLGTSLGQNTSLWQNPLWKLSSGGQSVFMPAKISDYTQHKKLQDYYDFEVNRPLQFQEQRHVFNLLANSPKITKKWECEVLFFGEEWFEHQGDTAWQAFYSYLLQEELKHHQHLSVAPTMSLLMSIIQEEKPIKFMVSQIEQMTQLFMLAQNGIPGFTPLIDESVMPLKLIQHIYLEDYKLMNYAPTIMGPGYLRDTGKHNEAIYLSYNYPAFYQFSPPDNKSASGAKVFYRLYWAFNKLKEFIKTENYLHPGHALCELIKNNEFIFYHSKPQGFEEFKSNEVIPLLDRAFMKPLNDGFSFPTKSAFFNGCVQIKKIYSTH